MLLYNINAHGHFVRLRSSVALRQLIGAIDRRLLVGKGVLRVCWSEITEGAANSAVGVCIVRVCFVLCWVSLRRSIGQSTAVRYFPRRRCI